MCTLSYRDTPDFVLSEPHFPHDSILVWSSLYLRKFSLHGHHRRDCPEEKKKGARVAAIEEPTEGFTTAAESLHVASVTGSVGEPEEVRQTYQRWPRNSPEVGTHKRSDGSWRTRSGAVWRLDLRRRPRGPSTPLWRLLHVTVRIYIFVCLPC